MKKNIILFGLFLISSVIWSQEEDLKNTINTVEELPLKERTTFVELGINASSLLTKLFQQKSDSIFSINEYHLTAKLLMNKWAIRTGGGVRWNIREDKISGFSDIITNEERSFNLRLGLERRFILSKRWQSYIGADGIYGYRGFQKISDSGFERIIDQNITTEYGANFVIGFQYELAKRFYIGSESSIGYSVFYSSSQKVFDVFDDFNGPKSESSGTSLNYNGPEIIYLIYKF